jgi:UDP-N-acetylmuramoyl-tripeptide--D-alanyl-D-alanine ligase
VGAVVEAAAVERDVIVLLGDPRGLVPAADPVVVVLADDAALVTAASAIRADHAVATVGYSAGADTRVTDIAVDVDGTGFVALRHGAAHPVRLALVGERHVPAALAALEVGLQLGLSPETAVAALAAVTAAESGNLETAASAHGRRLIDDGYDLTPLSTTEALKTLAEITRDRARSIAVLGELDLPAGTGPQESREEHDRIGRLVVRLNIDALIVIGQQARHIHNAAGLEGSWDGESVLVDTAEEAYDLLNDQLSERGSDTVVLVKSPFSDRLRALGATIESVSA